MKRFKRIYIEITNVCNLSCDFCPKTSRPTAFMTPDAFNIVLDKAAPFTDYIYLHLLGEPLLHPNLSEILNICYEKKIKVNITTNGTRIDKVGNVLLNAPSVRQINYSLHSFEANDYAESIDNYINKILDFILLSKEKTSIISALRLWNLPPSGAEGNADAPSTKNLQIYNIIAKRFDISEDFKHKLLEQGGIKLMDRVYLNLSHRFSWPDKNISLLSDTGFCYGLRDHIGILVDGTVVPCCLDNEGTINLGNIFEKDLSDILESKKALDLFNGFSKREVVEDLCKKCGYRHRFSLE
jgi:radical SAM protein with 4Fe4S-binding SPASM domain